MSRRLSRTQSRSRSTLIRIKLRASNTILKTLVGHREDLERKKLLGTRDGNGANRRKRWRPTLQPVRIASPRRQDHQLQLRAPARASCRQPSAISHRSRAASISCSAALGEAWRSAARFSRIPASTMSNTCANFSSGGVRLLVSRSSAVGASICRNIARFTSNVSWGGADEVT